MVLQVAENRRGARSCLGRLVVVLSRFEPCTGYPVHDSVSLLLTRYFPPKILGGRVVSPVALGKSLAM